MNLQNLRYWYHQRSKMSAPMPKGAIILKEGATIELDFRSPEALGIINSTDPEKVLATALASPSRDRRENWSAEATVRDEAGERTLRALEKSLPELETAIREKVATFEAEKERFRLDPYAHLESMMSKHDWYYQYSDDGSVWRSGQAAWDRIKALAVTLDPLRVAALYEKYIPKVPS